MGCSCFSADYIEEYVQLLSSALRKAAKDHSCIECLGVIFRGQTYLEECCLEDGSVYTFRTCACCESVRDHLFCTPAQGEIWADLQEQLHHAIHHSVDGVPWARLARLTPQARANVLLMIEEIWRDAGLDEEEGPC